MSASIHTPLTFEQTLLLLQHVKMAQFNVVLGLFGLAALWRAAALPAIGGGAKLHISHTVGDVLAVMAVVLYVLMALM